MTCQPLDVRIMRHLWSTAGPDGVATGATYGGLGQRFGCTSDQARRAIKRLEALGALAMTPLPGFPRKAAWRPMLTAAETAAAIEAAKPPPAEFGARTDVDREEQIRVSSRLLARLLKFHGDRPPDADAAAAVKALRAQFSERATA